MLFWVFGCIKMMIFGVFSSKCVQILFWFATVRYLSLNKVSGSLLLTWFARSSLSKVCSLRVCWSLLSELVFTEKKYFVSCFHHNSRTVTPINARAEALESLFKTLHCNDTFLPLVCHECNMIYFSYVCLMTYVVMCMH